MFKASRATFAWLLLSTSLFPVAAYAQEQTQVDVQAIGTLQYIHEDDADLGTANAGSEDSLSEQLAVRAGVDFNDEWRAYFHGRALNIDGGGGFDDDTGDSINTTDDGDSFLELRELYVLKRNLFGMTPWALQVGRQRVREPRALWWNSDNDLVRFNYDTSLLKGFIAAGEDMNSYRTGTGTDFMNDDEDRFRAFGEASYQYTLGHYIEGRVLYEDDHSGLEAPGTTIDANDRDNEDQNLVWAGVRATGTVSNTVPNVSALKYRADLIGVWGEEDNLTSIAAGAGTRTVTGSTNQDVSAWAFDGGVVIDPGQQGGPVGILGYAYGSGDNGGGTDNEFRQTDIQGTSSRTGIERQQQKNYGEVFRPELSNIHILNAGLGVPLSEATDIALSYFYYRLDEDATSLRSTGISAPLNGNDKSLGQEVDIALNVDLDKQFNIQPGPLEGMNFRLVTGGFFAGDAYNNAPEDASYRVFTELQFRF